jgi:hypothetical protein
MNVIFLDVDNVLNASASHKDLARRTGHQPFTSFSWRLWLRPSDGITLQSFGAQIVWATTWIEHEDELESLAEQVNLPFGLPRISHIDWNGGWSDCAKLSGVKEWLDNNDVNRVAWIDDALGPNDFNFIRERRKSGKPTIGITPSAKLGLQQKDFDQLRDFLLKEKQNDHAIK